MDYGLFVDIFVVLVVLGSALIAFLRGFIREVLTILGIVGGFFAAWAIGPLLAPHMRGWLGVVEEAGKDPEKFMGVIPMPFLADALAYGAIFVVMVILLSIVSHFLAELVKNLGLGALDRTLGVVFGLARAAVVLGLLYLPVFSLVGEKEKKEWFENSKSVVYLEATSASLYTFMPKNVEQKMEEGMKQIEQASETRKKLEDLGVLGDSDVEDIKKTLSSEKDGYGAEFRDQMDQLIEDNNDQPPVYNE